MIQDIRFPDSLARPADWPLAVVILLAVAFAALRLWIGRKDSQEKHGRNSR